jgi:hypothetical protein
MTAVYNTALAALVEKAPEQASGSLTAVFIGSVPGTQCFRFALYVPIPILSEDEVDPHCSGFLIFVAYTSASWNPIYSLNGANNYSE